MALFSSDSSSRQGTNEMSTHRIHRIGAVGLMVTVGLSFGLAVPMPATPAIPGVTTKTVTVKVGSRSFPARLSYPSRGGPYPALAFGHAHMARASWYASTLDALAQAGTVVIAPDSGTGIAASPNRLADDLNLSLAWLVSESRAGGTVVPGGKVDGSRTALAGHSMGGGAALLAAARSRTVDTVATLAPFEKSPPAATAARRVQVAALFVVGSADWIVHAADTALRFRRAPSASLLATITGGSHCGFMDKKPPWCDAHERISNPRQRALTREQLRRWLERYLKGTPGTRVTGLRGIAYTTSLSGALVRIHLEGPGLSGSNPGRGRFAISGAISDDGKFADDRAGEAGRGVRTFYGARGTIRITVGHFGFWRITKGTKAYAGLRGRGTGGNLWPGNQGPVDIWMEGAVSQ